MKRNILITLICAASALATGGARAQGPTVVTYTGSPETGAEIIVEAAPQTSNILIALLLPAVQKIELEDEAGVVAPDGAHCVQESPTKASCDATRLASLNVDLRDGNDEVNVSQSPAEVVLVDDIIFGINTGAGADLVTINLLNGPVSVNVRAGTGQDKVALDSAGTARGQGGDDRLVGGSGDQRLFGGADDDLLIGGASAHDVCDGGRDRDRKGRGCDRVVSIP